MDTHKTQAEIDQLTRAAFAAQGYAECACGAVIDTPGASVCYACRSGNRRRAALYGGALAPPVREA